MPLPEDVSRCNSNACPVRAECARRLDMVQGREYWMVNFLPQDGGECEDFIPAAVQ